MNQIKLVALLLILNAPLMAQAPAAEKTQTKPAVVEKKAAMKAEKKAAKKANRMTRKEAKEAKKAETAPAATH